MAFESWTNSLPQPPSASLAAQLPSAQSSRRVRISDAPPDLLDQIRQLLEGRGFRVDVDRVAPVPAASAAGAATPGSDAQGTTPHRLEDMSLEQVEGLLIRKAMVRFEGNVSRTAKSLGLSRSALYRRLHYYGL